ncbi:GreA/GreB family elongation factor [Jatrophihabitans telluris]|uniref:GreA/GreB family elongation factor n=1 Tax=Jatrophihabitans telluris TaxID=2038343 RepID=A0ABY4QW80_9ACTN|nr:GreA/GreB family elongation factor [Jatrophihabitans telluris]UQX87357.1 GreA/GreB family elongation factor [Jatrophihabitans telluris]
MTVDKNATTLSEVLARRLASMRSELATLRSELEPPSTSGDPVDRSTNVDAAIRIEDLLARIAELELQQQRPNTAEVVRVTLSFDADGGTETFLLSPYAISDPDLDVITTSSPLGRALQAANPGELIAYRSDSGHEIKVRLIAVDGIETAEAS